MERSKDTTWRAAHSALASVLGIVVIAAGASVLSAPFLIIERWAGFAVLALLATASFLLYRQGRLPRRPWTLMLGLLAALLLLLPAAFFAQLLEAGFDDGPFRGRPFGGDVARLEPSHVVAFRSGELVIYNRTGDEPPILAYLVNGTSDWAVDMDTTANPKYRNTEFRSVSGPLSVSYGLFRDRMDFLANWSYGVEHGYVYIWKFGGVQRFYLSW